MPLGLYTTMRKKKYFIQKCYGLLALISPEGHSEILFKLVEYGKNNRHLALMIKILRKLKVCF